MIAGEEAEREIALLAERLNKYQHEYYVLNSPTVSDREYDRLFDRLLRLEKQFPELLKPDSPTQRVGSDLNSEFPEFRHTIPVLSLDKTYTFENLQKWIEKSKKNSGLEVSFILEEKIDGASIVLYYEEGLLIRAVTRGNGIVGNDVTANIKTIGSVPLRLAKPVTVTVRGEIFLSKKLFESINAGMETPYANPRNLAAGTLRRVKSSEVAGIPLDIFVYEGYFSRPYSTHVEILEELHDLGFKLNHRTGFFSDSENCEKVREQHPDWRTGRLNKLAHYLEQSLCIRKSLDYEIDGLVVKVNEIEARNRLGFTGHHPRWAIAYKFEAPEAVTIIENIEVQVGRTGRITPVARVVPVKVSGSTISNATLHNQDTIDLLELSIGDQVSISKRGDVIPAVERVIEKNETGNTTWKMPSTCPACSTVLIQSGAHLFCPNSQCKDQVRGKIRFFAARNQMDIENLGPETIDILIEKELIRNAADLYRFNPDDLLDLPGFGQKKIELIKAGLKKSKGKPYSIVLQSLGIPEVGPNVAELLIKAGFSDIGSLLEAADRQDPQTFLTIHGIGEKTASTIIREFLKPDIRQIIHDLKQAGLNFREQESPTGEEPEGVFSGQTWCVTGSFLHFKPRELAMEEVKKRGGRITSSVTSKTTHLLAGTGAGSKLDKAHTLGVSVVQENEFLKMLDTASSDL